MSILTSDMRKEFISGLSAKYAKSLPSKMIGKKGDIMFAAANLYAFGTPFWTRGGQKHLTVNFITNIEKMLDTFVTKIEKYFISSAPSTQSIFNDFHNELCTIFLSDCKTNGYIHTYGNAQKMINIMFKYLSCFEDAAKYKDWFKYCHLTLDRFTYNGYRLPFYRDIVYPRMHGSSATALTNWSELESYEYTPVTNDIIDYVNSHPKTYNYYLDICQKELHILSSISHLSDDYILTPFEAEFFLWIIAKKCIDKSVNNAIIKNIKSLL